MTLPAAPSPLPPFSTKAYKGVGGALSSFKKPTNQPCAAFPSPTSAVPVFAEMLSPGKRLAVMIYDVVIHHRRYLLRRIGRHELRCFARLAEQTAQRLCRRCVRSGKAHHRVGTDKVVTGRCPTTPWTRSSSCPYRNCRPEWICWVEREATWLCRAFRRIGQ